MAAEFKKFHVEDYPTLTRAGAVDFTVFSALIHKFLDQFKWNKFKILYEQQGINVSDDFCKIMSSSIYYTPSNKRKDYFNLGDLGDLENIIISEIGIGYGGMYIVWLEFINGKRDTTLITRPLQPHILVDLFFFLVTDHISRNDIFGTVLISGQHIYCVLRCQGHLLNYDHKRS